MVIQFGTWEAKANKKYFYARKYIKGIWTPFCYRELLSKRIDRLCKGKPSYYRNYYETLYGVGGDTN